MTVASRYWGQQNRQTVMLVLLFVLYALPSHAAPANWGTMICQLGNQSAGWVTMVSWTAYITGAWFIFKFLLKLKERSEDPHRNPMHHSILYGFTGASLLSLPSFAAMLIKTIYGNLAVGGAAVCTAGTVAAAPPGTFLGLDKLAHNFVFNIANPVLMFGSWIAYCIGAVFIFRGLNKMSKYNTDPKAYSAPAIIANFFFGAILMTLGRAKNLLMSTIGFNQGLVKAKAGFGFIDWAALGVTGNTAAFDQAYLAATVFFQLVGFIAFIRGWLIAKTVVEGASSNQTIGQALTHIVGGILCMNIILFLKAAELTFGIKFLT